MNARRTVFLIALAACVAGTTAWADRLPIVSNSEKGSIFIFSKVELRWDASDDLIQDTLLQLTNDYSADVLVQMYFIQGDPPLAANPTFPGGAERAHPGWNWVDNKIRLTRDEPTFWSAATGLPKGVSPFTVLDPGDPPGRPDYVYSNGEIDGDPDLPISTERVLRGYVIGWAVAADGEEIRWNHLKGEATIVNFQDLTAWEYNTWNFAALDGHSDDPNYPIVNGEKTGTPGVLNLDGVEYAEVYTRLLLDFFAIGAVIDDQLGGPSFTVETDVTLFPVSVDLRQDNQGPVRTKADFIIYRGQGTFLSTTAKRCIICWDQALLSQYEDAARFKRTGSGGSLSDKNYADINGNLSTDCPDSQNAALLGVAAKYITYTTGGAKAVAGMSLSAGHFYDGGVEDRTQSAVIKYDVPSGPDELTWPPQHRTGSLANVVNTNPAPAALDAAPIRRN